MLESFVIVLREGIEAALVVAIVVAALRKAGREDLYGRVAQGIAVAVAVSIAGGIVLRGAAFDGDATELPDARLAGFVATMMSAELDVAPAPGEVSTRVPPRSAAAGHPSLAHPPSAGPGASKPCFFLRRLAQRHDRRRRGGAVGSPWPSRPAWRSHAAASAST
jgi:hypothetical protein